MLINSLLASSFHPVISSVMSTKGGISSSSDFSPCFASFTKWLSVKELGCGWLFGRFWVDVTFLASIDNTLGELFFSSEVVSFAQGMFSTCVVSVISASASAWTSQFALVGLKSVSSPISSSCWEWVVRLHETPSHECAWIHCN